MSPGCKGSPDVRWRALTAADLHDVYELEVAGEAFDDGVVEVSESDLEADWSRPDFDPATMSTGAFSGSRLVAYALVFQGRAEALVHPEHRGRGLGTVLARWTWAVARSEGRDRVGETISDNEGAAEALFVSLGYERGHTSWIIRRDLSEPRPAPALPPGYGFRPYLPGKDELEIYGLIDEAFAEWRGADSESMGFENWAASYLRDLAPEAMVLLEHGRRLVGAVVGHDYELGGEGWIEQIAVRRELRGQGLGRALLEESFRRYREAGRTLCGVSTDSRTGALGLYQHVGMSVVRSYTRWVKAGL